MVTFSFDLGHPAHYLLFRDVLRRCQEIGFEPLIFIQEKGELKKLLIEDQQHFWVKQNKGTTLSRASLLFKDAMQLRRMFKKSKVIDFFGVWGHLPT